MNPTRARLVRCIVFAFALLTIPPSWGDDWLYTIRPGDKLWNIAETYCGSGRLAQAIADHNGFSSSAPLQAGQRIAIPTSLLAFAPSSATVMQATGNIVLLRTSGTQATAAAGDVVNMGDHIISSDGAALVVFADGSQISISPNSRVLFNKLTAFGPAGMVDTHLRFAYGQGEATVNPQNRGDRFRIQTPEGIAAVRGTRFRVGRSSEDGQPTVSTTETLEGLVAFSGQGQQTDIPSGFGVAAGAAGIVKEALLEPPVFNPLQQQVTANTSLSWQPLAEAREYVIEWARQAQPEIIFLSDRVSTTQIPAPETPGSYLLTVRGLSSSMIQGKNAEQPVTVLEPAPANLAATISPPGQVALTWQPIPSAEKYSILVKADHWQTEQIWESTDSAYSTGLEAGVYRWRVKPATGAISGTQSFTILPDSPEILDLTQQKLKVSLNIKPAAEGIRYQVELINSAGDVVNTQYSKGITEIDLPDFGRYRVRVASEQNSLHSKPVITPVEALQKPWWLVLLIPLLAF